MAKAVVILGFLLSFAAGLVIGTRSHTGDSPSNAATSGGSSTGVHATATTQPAGGARRGSGSWWQTELGLTPDQRVKLDKIWSPMAAKGRTEHDERRRDYRRERDTAVADLVPVAQRGDYDKIIDTYNERLATLDRESREAYEAAVEQTRQMLTPEQRPRYEDLLKRFHMGPSGNGGPRDRHPSSSPSSRHSETRPTPDAAATVPADRNVTAVSPSQSSSFSSTSSPAPRAGDAKGAS